MTLHLKPEETEMLAVVGSSAVSFLS